MFYIKKEDGSVRIKLLFLKFRIYTDIQNFIVRKMKWIFYILDFILPKDSKKIAFILYPKQEDKSEAFIEYIEREHPDFSCIRIIGKKNYINKNKQYFEFYKLRTLYEILTAKYIVVTVTSYMLDYFISKKHTYINLWHGMPIKTSALNAEIKDKSIKRFKALGKKYKHFATSDVFRLVLASSFLARTTDIYITGLPITDTIFSDNSEKIEEVFNISKYNKIIFYLPTFKSKAVSLCAQVNHDFNNIFYFDDYSKEDFIKFIEKHNILFITKPHPLDEELYKNNPNLIPTSDNFKILYDEDLKNNEIVFYSIFKYVDLMISDFSSVTIDYLILNRPVIYLTNLTESYNNIRGMILPDNTNLYMPGAVVNNMEILLKELDENLYKDSYKSVREQIIPLMHKYCDNKASERIFEIMKGL